jgi:hypothetical protein
MAANWMKASDRQADFCDVGLLECVEHGDNALISQSLVTSAATITSHLLGQFAFRLFP